MAGGDYAGHRRQGLECQEGFVGMPWRVVRMTWWCWDGGAKRRLAGWAVPLLSHPPRRILIVPLPIR